MTGGPPPPILHSHSPVVLSFQGFDNSWCQDSGENCFAIDCVKNSMHYSTYKREGENGKGWSKEDIRGRVLHYLTPLDALLSKL